MIGRFGIAWAVLFGGVKGAVLFKEIPTDGDSLTVGNMVATFHHKVAKEPVKRNKKRKHKRWQDSDDEFIISNRNMPDKMIGEKLKRNYKAVSSRKTFLRKKGKL